MRVAILSDMHGNCVGFDAVLADLRRQAVDQIVCLGDTVQGGAQPAQTLQRLRDLACPVVMGNTDAWLISGDTGSLGESVSEEQETVRRWSMAQLSDADRAFMAGFQPTVTVPLDAGQSLLCFHGSPTSYNDVILPSTAPEEVQRLLGPYTGHILTGGHTHLQQIRRLGDSFFFNPGAAGFAYSHDQPEDDFRVDPWAEYAILTVADGMRGLEFRRVPFDVGAVCAAIRASGRPHADTLLAMYEPRQG